MSKWFLASMLMILGFALPSFAAPGKAITDAAEAGPDFEVQGEYSGERDGEKVGVQVIARGEGKFDLTIYSGGLPGDGYNDRSQKKEMQQGKSTDEVKKAIEGLKKVDRRSNTEGARPPADATVLFDGSSVEHWENGRMTEDKLLMVGTKSKPEFRDFTMHLEFRNPYMPQASGQGRGNSGVYLQNRYEVQVLDSFGLEGKDNECGGIYQAAGPKVNMCYPPLSWQTYDVDFTAARFDESMKKTKNARVTVKHNGVVIHDDLELPHHTPGGANQEYPGKGPLQLQDHGNPVHYRNIWVVEKK